MKMLTSYREICTTVKVRMENIVNVIFPLSLSPNHNTTIEWNKRIKCPHKITP